MNFFRPIAVLGTVLLFMSCGSETENKTSEQVTPKDSVKSEPVFKVYSLPAPMQLPHAIRATTDNFSEEFLKPTNSAKPTESSAINKAVTLGIFGVDFGYCLLFDQNQHAINYLSKISKLSSDLKISGAFENKIIKRLKDNLNNKDSASYILLSSYNEARNFFKANKRDESGYLIAAGSFIEGLHLSLSIYHKKPSPEMLKVIGQQKLFLDNITELLEPYCKEEAEIRLLNDNLKLLKADYDNVKLTLAPSPTEKNVQDISSVEASAETLSSLLKKTETLRQIVTVTLR
jgi:hypothetical protein